jgi:hypothetical protein
MSDAVDAARTFVEAVVWGDHLKVWESLGLEARTIVLKVASDRGMDEALMARLRDGTATDGERDEFLGDLVNGLRADLSGNDLDAFGYEADELFDEPGRARVVVTVPAPPMMGRDLPVASVELDSESGDWRVVRMVPQSTK